MDRNGVIMKKILYNKCKALLYNGNNKKILKQLFIKGIKVNTVITDPPYLYTSHGGTKCEMAKRMHKVKKEIAFMSNSFDYNVFKLCEDLGCQNFISFCSNNQISSLMQWFENRGYSVNLLVWHKTNAPPLGNGKYVGDFEYIIFARKGRVSFNNKLNVKYKSRLYQYPIVYHKAKLHPSQKPIELITRLVKLHSLKGDTVLDLFMGSGTTGVACKHLKRNFIGIELNKEYYKIAKKRILEE